MGNRRRNGFVNVKGRCGNGHEINIIYIGMTSTDLLGNYTVEGCADDFGAWNDPDPFVIKPANLAFNSSLLPILLQLYPDNASMPGNGA